MRDREAKGFLLRLRICYSGFAKQRFGNWVRKAVEVDYDLGLERQYGGCFDRVDRYYRVDHLAYRLIAYWRKGGYKAGG